MLPQIGGRSVNVGSDVVDASGVLFLREDVFANILEGHKELKEVAAEHTMSRERQVKFRSELRAKVRTSLLGQSGKRGSPVGGRCLALAVIGKRLTQAAGLLRGDVLGLQVLEGRHEARVPGFAEQFARIDQTFTGLRPPCFKGCDQRPSDITHGDSFVGPTPR